MKRIIFVVLMWGASFDVHGACMSGSQCNAACTDGYCCPTSGTTGTTSCPSGWTKNSSGICEREPQLYSCDDTGGCWVGKFGTCSPTPDSCYAISKTYSSGCIACKSGNM